MSRYDRELALGQDGLPIRIRGIRFFAWAGLLVGIAIYAYLALNHLTYTEIAIIDAAETMPAALHEKIVPERSPGYLPWSGEIQTGIQIDPDFPIVEVKQKNDQVENILVFGIEAHQEGESSSLADSLFILTIDQQHRCVKMTSLLSNLPVDIEGRRDTESIVSAYALGGAGLLINTVNESLNLDVQRFFMFDFWRSGPLIDALGGVEMTIPDQEIRDINRMIAEQIGTSRLSANERIIEPGRQRLSGQQAIAWARIRDLDADQASIQTSRQQEIVGQLLLDGSRASLPNLMILMQEGADSFDTNLDAADMLRVSLGLLSVSRRIYLYQVPEEGLYEIADESEVLTVDWQTQIDTLADFIWGKPTGEPYDFRQEAGGTDDG